jgi:transcriptional regulator with XRE-family HTH domain
MKTIPEKLIEIRRVTGWNQMQLAEKFEVSQSTVNRWLSGSEPEGHRRDAINDLYDSITSSQRSIGVREITVAAHVQAGEWAESWEWEEQDRYQVYIPDDPEYKNVRLYAAVARGPSMNKRYPEGTILVFANIEETGEQLIPGKRYIVERRRAGGDAEHTVKTLHIDAEGKHWLVPESDDPRYQAPISIEDGMGEEDVVSIVGRVCFAVSRE